MVSTWIVHPQLPQAFLRAGYMPGTPVGTEERVAGSAQFLTPRGLQFLVY